MVRKNIPSECDYFTNYLDWIINLLNKIEDEKNKVLTLDERREIIESLVLKIDVNWMYMVKRVFYWCLAQDTSKYAELKKVKLNKKISIDLGRLIINGNNYLDFKSVGDIQKLAKNILVDKFNPFRNIDKKQKDLIDDFYSIRNFIAHQSMFQYTKFLKIVKVKNKLTKFTQPGKFLCGISKEDKNNSRLGVYILTFYNVAEGINTYLKNI